MFGFDSVVGNHGEPDTPGSAYVLLHHVFGEVNGEKGAWGHAIGGMGAITQAMASACRAAGVEIRTEAPVERVIVDGGKAAGVHLDSGELVAAPIVVANVGPKPLYEKLVDPSDLPADFRSRIGAYNVGSGTFRMNVALSELPRFTALPEAGPHLSAGIILAPTLDYMDAAFEDSRTQRLDEAAGGRDADPLDARRQPRPARRACRQPVLPELRPDPTRWPFVGR